MTEIHPAADALKHLDPDAGIFENVRAAEIVKLFDAVFLNLFAAGNAKLLSADISAGRPWQSHPKRRSTFLPFIV